MDALRNRGEAEKGRNPYLNNRRRSLFSVWGNEAYPERGRELLCGRTQARPAKRVPDRGLCAVADQMNNPEPRRGFDILIPLNDGLSIDEAISLLEEKFISDAFERKHIGPSLLAERLINERVVALKVIRALAEQYLAHLHRPTRGGAIPPPLP